MLAKLDREDFLSKAIWSCTHFFPFLRNIMYFWSVAKCVPIHVGFCYKKVFGRLWKENKVSLFCRLYLSLSHSPYGKEQIPEKKRKRKKDRVKNKSKQAVLLPLLLRRTREEGKRKNKKRQTRQSDKAPRRINWTSFNECSLPARLPASPPARLHHSL